MKAIFAAALLASLPLTAWAQSDQDLRASATRTDAVLTYGQGYGLQRFSPLTQIDKQTVKRLVPAWAYSMDSSWGEEAQPMVKDGVIFVSNHDKTVAIDAVTGREIWKTPVDYPAEAGKMVCCNAQVSRGTALYNGKVIRNTLNGFVIALDQKTGKEVWRAKFGDNKDGVALNGAPLVANGVVIAGASGAEKGMRGYLAGFDAETGKELWKHYTIPAPGEKGSESWPANSDLWKMGGGSAWLTGSYDPDLDLVFWGIGNPAPWNPLVRPGDNLFTNSMIAFRPKTGEWAWYYQTTPNDPFDYDGINALVLAEIPVDGAPKKVIIQANRSGIFYVVERATGKLVAANPYVKVTWTEGIDKQTGRPIPSDAFKRVMAGENVEIWPSGSGGTNWFPMSYSPQTGLAYVNTMNLGTTYQAIPAAQVPQLKVGGDFQQVKRTNIAPEIKGYLNAIDPLTGKSKWQIPFKSPNWSGTLVTASNIVFSGTMTGDFIAVDAQEGQVLWHFQTSSGIIAPPVTWEQNGKQMIAVLSGIGGVYTPARDPGIKNVPKGGSLWAFKLLEE